MKMAIEDYNRILTTFKDNKELVVAHYCDIESSGKFKVLEVRVAWDCLRGFLGNSFSLEQYDKGLNDVHITTACVMALKTVLEK